MKNNTSLHDKLIEDIYATIKRKILILSEGEIDQIFNNIGKSIDNSDQCNELYILEKLRNKFEDKIIYHHALLHRKYNWDAFNLGVTVLISIGVLVGLLYHYNIIEKLVAFFKASTSHEVGALGFVFTVIVKCIYKLILKSMIFVLWAAIIVIMAIFILIGQWLWPNDKECYEKWKSIKEKVEKRISVLEQ
jgi:hypothetical protein